MHLSTSKWLGALQYLTLTRPKISVNVNKLSLFIFAPTDLHWLAVKRLLRYLQARISYGLHMTKCTMLDVVGFSDWGGSPCDRKSTGTFVCFMGIILCPRSVPSKRWLVIL